MTKKIITKKVILYHGESGQIAAYLEAPNERVLTARILQHGDDHNLPNVFYRTEILLVIEVEETDDPTYKHKVAEP